MLTGHSVLLDQQDDFYDLFLQDLMDADPCCSPFASKTDASKFCNRTKCSNVESVRSLKLDRNKLSALTCSSFIKHGNRLTKSSITFDMAMAGTGSIKSHVHSMDDSQIPCHKKSLPPPMPFVRNALDRVTYGHTASSVRREYNFRVGLSLHAERLTHQKLCS
jgi:hypothetical protein